MTQAIHKYSPLFGDFHRDNSVLMDLPIGAEALYAATQRNEIFFYAIVDPEEKTTERRRVYIYGTGYPLHHSIRAQSLGVCSLYDDNLMFHVFIEPANVDDICTCGNPSGRILTVNPPLCGDCGKRFS